MAHCLLVTLELVSSIIGLHSQHRLLLEDLILFCRDHLLWLEHWRPCWTLFEFLLREHSTRVLYAVVKK